MKIIPNCKNCKHFDKGFCKAFKFNYVTFKEGKPVKTNYFIKAKESRSNIKLCGPEGNLFNNLFLIPT
jgi:hypothetical protein